MLRAAQFEVSTEFDRVVLKIGRTEILAPHQEAARIAQGLRLGAKEAYRQSGEDPATRRQWRSLVGDAQFHGEQIPEVNPARRSATPLRRFNWSIRFESENVIAQFAELEVGLHFTDALTWSERIRTASRTAKAWAGDTGRALLVSGSLTDAEDNYRRGLN